VTFSGYTVLCSTHDGSVSEGRHGLFHRDTRVLSRYRLTVDGMVPELVSDTTPESDRWDAVLRVPRPGGAAEGPLLPQDALELRIQRRVGPGMLESLTLTNHSAVACETTIRIELEADFADVAELDGRREQQGTVERTAEPDAGALRFDYAVERDGRRVERGLRIDVTDASSPPQIDASGLRFAIRLEAGDPWHATLRFAPLDAGAWPAPDSLDDDARARQRDAWRARRPKIECAEALRGPFDRAADDLFDLRNWELEQQFLGTTSGAAWILNAGVPTFTGLFGRDILTAGWQSSLLGPRAALGGLEAIASTQAVADDPWRDAEPGKLIHELRCGPVSELGLGPRDAYYGTQTTPAMFVLALSELWHWTGDTDLLRRHRDVALRALEWAKLHGDADGDGFVEYERRSPRGLRNQGWKDSDEAIRYPDGTIVDGPIATVEEQAFYFLALERMAEILVALGEDDLAEMLLGRADALRGRWHQAYWMPDQAFYALALDGSKNQVRSIASNPGHALGTGIVPARHARAIADRLFADDLFSGWGVRSLSDRHPSYNPFAYHLGALWPVEQATFALGFKRYGLDDHVDRLVDAVFAAAFRSPDERLPEALSGHARDGAPTPIPYPKANSPQAWSASSLIQLVQIMLGLYPFAPLRLVAIVRPRLPSWLPELTIRGMQVGPATVDLRFRRRPDGSASWSVVGRRGRLLVVGAGPPTATEPGDAWERLEYALLRRVPGRLVRAGRIALGLR
jgi:glycogen debranching enzyme